MDELEKRVSSIVEKVLLELMAERGAGEKQTSAVRPSGCGVSYIDRRAAGVFDSVEEAVAAAEEAWRQYSACSGRKKEALIQVLRDAGLQYAEPLAKLAAEETKLGRFEDKIRKNQMAAQLTPGMEDLTTEVFAGPKETVFVEYGAYGVAASITPATNPTSTIINHAIGLLSAGNSVCFAPHPASKNCAVKTIELLNQAIMEHGGPENLLTMCADVSLDSVAKILASDKIKLVIATGGAGLVKTALQAGKKCVAGGPGNPPVVVDETADIAMAAKNIVEGASFDNNILCISEKETFAVECVFEDLMTAFAQLPEVAVLNAQEMERLVNCIIENGHAKKEYIGRNPSVILQAIGKRVDDRIRLIVGETNADCPLVAVEQLMPVMPVVRVKDFDEAAERAQLAEHGYRHTAVIYSRDLQRVTRFADMMEVTLLCHNTPSFTGLGVNGAGKYTSTLAGPTGEGVTTSKTFARQRRYIAPAD